jgi:RNA polymerase sigma factor (sigma-70 family)
MRSRTQGVGGLGSTSEATLFRQAQAGCRDSLNLLMARHEGLVHAVVRRYGFGDLALTEALHLGRIGLWRAIVHYTPERGVAFSTYAWPCIRNELLHVERAQARRKKLLKATRAVLLEPYYRTLSSSGAWNRAEPASTGGATASGCAMSSSPTMDWRGKPGSTYAAIGAQLADQATRVSTPHRGVGLVTPTGPLADLAQLAGAAHGGGV